VASPLLLLVVAPITAIVHAEVILRHILIVVDVIVYVMTYEKLLLLLRILPQLFRLLRVVVLV
jgi:hypothetical protein